MPFRLIVTSVQEDALMLAQVLGLRWGKPTVQIFRRSDDMAHALSDALGDQARILQFAKADGDIDIFGYQVQEQVGDEQIGLDARISLQKRGQECIERLLAEDDRC